MVVAVALFFPLQKKHAPSHDSANSFPAIGVLAVLIEGLVVIGLSSAAEYKSPFAVIYMTW